MKNKIFFYMFSILILTSGVKAYSQQANFQVTPPPIPWYEFSEGSRDLKASATVISMTGEIDDPDYGGDVKVYGGGISGFYRYAFRNEFAFDFGGTVMGASGDIGSATTMKMGMLSIPLDLEFQPINNDRLTLILFGGFSFSWLKLRVDFDDGTDWGKVDIYTFMRGPQGGIQAAIKFNDFVFTPFFMITKLGGNATIDMETNAGSTSVSSGVKPTRANLYGIDIIYKPLDITLSSILQQAASTSDSSGYKTFIFMISYHFDMADNSAINTENKGQSSRAAREKTR